MRFGDGDKWLPASEWVRTMFKVVGGDVGQVQEGRKVRSPGVLAVVVEVVAGWRRVGERDLRKFGALTDVTARVFRARSATLSVLMTPECNASAVGELKHTKPSLYRASLEANFARTC